MLCGGGENWVGTQFARLIQDLLEQRRTKEPNEWTAPVRST